MDEPVTVPLGLRISDADFAKLKAGFKPQSQDDKWIITATATDESDSESGTISVHVARFSMGKDFFVLIVKPIESSSGIGSGATIEAITFESTYELLLGERSNKEEAQRMALGIVKGKMRCDFDALPEDYF
jgi:hypothetical protein